MPTNDKKYDLDDAAIERLKMERVPEIYLKHPAPVPFSFFNAAKDALRKDNLHRAAEMVDLALGHAEGNHRGAVELRLFMAAHKHFMGDMIEKLEAPAVSKPRPVNPADHSWGPIETALNDSLAQSFGRHTGPGLAKHLRAVRGEKNNVSRLYGGIEEAPVIDRSGFKPTESFVVTGGSQ